MDLLKELGPFTFASRLMRLSHRLKSEASTVYHACGLDFDDHWFLIGYLLARHESMTPAEMAKRLGFAQPDIITMTDGMVERGLLRIESDANNPMKRRLSLTDEGRETVESLGAIWEAVGDVTQELIQSTHPELLEGLAKLEHALEERSLFSRVQEKLEPGPAACVEDEADEERG